MNSDEKKLALISYVLYCMKRVNKILDEVAVKCENS